MFDYTVRYLTTWNAINEIHVEASCKREAERKAIAMIDESALRRILRVYIQQFKRR